MSSFLSLLESFSDYLWYIPFALIVIAGLYSTYRLKFIQLTHIKEMAKVTFSRQKKEGKVSSFHVFCVSMGNRIGVGNITGPVLAILVGGPGAIFWMWIFAFLGGATCYIETAIGQLYKSRGKDGLCIGGPAFNVSKGLGMKKFGLVVAFIMVLMYVFGFVASEISQITITVSEVVSFENSQWVIAIAMTVLAGIIVAGGFKRVANISVWLVPGMAVCWVVMCLASVIISGGFFSGIAQIFTCAFSVPATVGGGVGAMLMIGMKRGIWSNEAGIGTITNISSVADVSHPGRQALSQSLGVLVDVLVCTLTALVVLSYGDHSALTALDMEALPTLQNVLGTTIGGFTKYLVPFFIFVFAITSFMGDFVIGQNNMSLISEKKEAKLLFLAVLMVVVFVSCFYASDEIIVMADIMFAICGIVNIFVLVKLFGRAMEVYRDYKKQKEDGVEEPVFSKSTLSDDSGITEWE